MTEIRISEADSAQFPMIAHAIGIGWSSLSPDAARLKRGGDSGMLFRDDLTAKLAEFNVWLSSDAIRQLIEKLEAIPPTIEGNREMLAWLRGERQWYDENEKRHRHVQLVDFAAAANNKLHVTWQWMLKPAARKPGGGR